MSTNPEDRLVNVLSQWLARHVDDDELRREVEAVDASELDAEKRVALDELRQELAKTDGGGDLEMVVRETLQALALGG
jgi:uncharacterized protein (DUF885 family)